MISYINYHDEGVGRKKKMYRDGLSTIKIWTINARKTALKTHNNNDRILLYDIIGDAVYYGNNGWI